MSGFKSKVGEFSEQFEEFKSKPQPLREVSTKEYNDFFLKDGGPHQLEGMMSLGGAESEYINIRRSKVLGGELTIEPVHKVTNEGKDSWVVATNPMDIQGYRVKMTGGKFFEDENRWEFEATKVVEVAPGSGVATFHKDLDAALRIKFSLAERLLEGDAVQEEIKTYRAEQTFYKGDFGKIIAADPVKEPYLRDAFLSEIERVVINKDHAGIKTANPDSLHKNKLELEFYPRNFMGAKCITAKVVVQRVGGHGVVIFSDSKPGSLVTNQFEIHGGRAIKIMELVMRYR